MMERILAPENLAAAWKRVKANKGAPGIDGMTVEAFPAFCREHWPRILTAILEGTYRPARARRVFIPKPDGTQRPLGVPTLSSYRTSFKSLLNRLHFNTAGAGNPIS
jgi:RNA-directed DNA polymerase